MSTIRVVWGTATAETPMLSYDAALADANVHNYNLVAVSSVIPAGATIDPCGVAPYLGPAGERLTVVEGRQTLPPGAGGQACAGLGWAVEDSGRGIFYEGSGADPEAVEAEVRTGLDGGKALREWAFDDEQIRTVCADTDGEGYTTALVLAVYGDSDPLV
jgi:arginine decarboxylase